MTYYEILAQFLHKYDEEFNCRDKVLFLWGKINEIRQNVNYIVTGLKMIKPNSKITPHDLGLFNLQINYIWISKIC